MLSWIFMDFVFQYYHKAHKNIAFSIENSLPQLAAKFFPQKGANLKSKKAHCALSKYYLSQIVLIWLKRCTHCARPIPEYCNVSTADNFHLKPFIDDL